MHSSPGIKPPGDLPLWRAGPLLIFLFLSAPICADNQIFNHVIGETVSLDVPEPGAGHIETPGSSDTYLFHGVAGERLYIEVLAGAITLADMRLTAPDDSVLFNATGLVSRGPITLPLSGTYELRIAGRSDATGTYSFRTTLTIDQTFNHQIGDTVSDGVPEPGAGNIETPGSTDTYLFEGSAGQRIYIRILAGPNVASMRLTAPDNSALFDATGLIDRGPITLPHDGTYALRIAGLGSATATYSFRINETIDQTFNHQIGDTVSDGVPEPGAGHIETPGSTDTYLFAGSAGQRIYIRILAGPSFLADMHLTAPDDSIVFNLGGLLDRGPITLPHDGTYALRIAGRGSATGPYSFRINETVDEIFDYHLGDLVSEDQPAPGAGRLEEPGSTDTYLFTAEAGQSFRFVYQGGAMPMARVRLTVPDGSVLFETSTLASSGPYTLPESGLYQLRIASQNANTGPYAFLTASALGAPEQLSLLAGDGELTVSWLPPSVDDGLPPDLYVATASPGGASCSTSGLSCVIDGLNNGTFHAVRVVASNAQHDSFPSPPVFGTPQGRPGPPQGLIAIATDGGAQIEWQPPASDGGSAILGYSVSAEPGGSGCEVDAPGCTLEGLTNGTTYAVTVFARNALGDGPEAGPVEVTPRPDPFESITELKAPAGPVRVGEAIPITARVSGGDTAPMDGRVSIVANSGESCSDNGPPGSTGLQAVFSCAISFAHAGQRSLTASFEDSLTHLDSSSQAETWSAMYFADLSVTIDDGRTASTPGEFVSYSITVTNSGPDAAPTSQLTVTVDPPLEEASWICQAPGNATCPAASGPDAIDVSLDLATGDTLNLVLSGRLPESLPARVTATARIAADGDLPNAVFDPVPANNLDTDVNQVDELFEDRFE